MNGGPSPLDVFVPVAEQLRLPFGLLLAGCNAVRTPQCQLRVRVVVHAGLVHYDANGCFGEDVDTTFRLLDAGVKEAPLPSARGSRRPRA